MRWLAFLAALAACATPSILVSPDDPHSCRQTESPCVNGSLEPTGTCCPEGWACGGAFPNVGCPDGYCCPAAGSVSEYMMPVRQRAAK